MKNAPDRFCPSFCPFFLHAPFLFICGFRAWVFFIFGHFRPFSAIFGHFWSAILRFPSAPVFLSRGSVPPTKRAPIGDQVAAAGRTAWKVSPPRKARYRRICQGLFFMFWVCKETFLVRVPPTSRASTVDHVAGVGRTDSGRVPPCSGPIPADRNPTTSFSPQQLLVARCAGGKPFPSQ